MKFYAYFLFEKSKWNSISFPWRKYRTFISLKILLCMVLYTSQLTWQHIDDEDFLRVNIRPPICMCPCKFKPNVAPYRCNIKLTLSGKPHITYILRILKYTEKPPKSGVQDDGKVKSIRITAVTKSVSQSEALSWCGTPKCTYNTYVMFLFQHLSVCRFTRRRVQKCEAQQK